MRIVLYNFGQPGDPSSKQGGGVAIYQGNLMVALRDKGHEVICLSSGEAYTILDPKPRLEFRSVDGFERAIILNSPVFAPGHSAFYDLNQYTLNDGLNSIPSDLLRKYGDIDAFHFQNVEGLTAPFFEALRRTFPRAQIVVSAHNYYMVCPQVNLWFREHQVCRDYRDGAACVNCLTLSPDRHRFERNVRRVERAINLLRLQRSPLGRQGVTLAMRATIFATNRLRRLRRTGASDQSADRLEGVVVDNGVVVTSPQKARPYKDFRQSNIALAHHAFDTILAVSQRTKTVLAERGMPEDKITVSYIGTAQHAHAESSVRKTIVDGHLHIAFLGYMRADKGFFFLLDALFSLHDEVAKDITITIAAPIWDQYPIDRLRGMSHRFRKIVVLNGYSHGQLTSLLADVDLGVVPVLWEDNLPQVAIEFVTRGVPILTSDRGGAQEIGGDPDFIFESGSVRDFCLKVSRILRGETPLAAFWSRPPKIFSMQHHVDELISFYEPPARSPARGAPVRLGRSRAAPIVIEPARVN